MSGLAGYTLLLASTACLLVRLAAVWDDVRTVLLLVVLMFLATSVTFDELLVNRPDRGFYFSLAGLLFAGAVSEAVLRATRLRLPAVYRVPYYLILGLFFLYPLALSPLAQPAERVGLQVVVREELLWGMFGFASAAGLVFLTLLPAVRRGRDAVRANGSPWRWPLYPWVLFGLLAFAVAGRAFLLCWSMHLLEGRDRERLIFGLYFLVPFGLALAALLLESALVRRGPGVLAAALAIPAGLVVLAFVGHRDDPVYRGFLDLFTSRLGGTPPYLALLAVAAFYAYAGLRGAPFAAEALTAALAALAVVGPATLTVADLTAPRPEPLVVAAAVQLGLGLWRHSAWRCLLGSVALTAAVGLAFGVPVAFHLALAAALLLGATFDDAIGRVLRSAGAVLALTACAAALLVPLNAPENLPGWLPLAYAAALAGLLALYGLLLRHRPALACALLALSCWAVAAGWRGYSSARRVVTGLDHIVLSLVVFALALLISLGKSGLLGRWLAALGWTAPPPAPVAEPPPVPAPTAICAAEVGVQAPPE